MKDGAFFRLGMPAEKIPASILLLTIRFGHEKMFRKKTLLF